MLKSKKPKTREFLIIPKDFEGAEFFKFIKALIEYKIAIHATASAVSSSQVEPDLVTCNGGLSDYD